MGIAYFILTLGVYSEAEGRHLQVIGLGFVLSRALSGLALVSFQKAKNTGLLRTFADAAANRKVAFFMTLYLILTGAGMLVLDVKLGAAAIGAALLVFWWCRSMAYRKFGGITGDLAGCFVQVCELAVALAVVLAGR